MIPIMAPVDRPGDDEVEAEVGAGLGSTKTN